MFETVDLYITKSTLLLPATFNGYFMNLSGVLAKWFVTILS